MNLTIDEILGRIRFRDWWFRVLPIGDGFSLQVCFVAAGAAQHGRKWYVSSHATDGEVVQTALKSVLTALEHEAREDFTYRGRAIFGPHCSLDALHAACDQRVERGNS